MEADFVEIQQQNSHNSAIINENPIPSFQNHENKGDYFAQKLKEIDKDLGFYEEPQNTGLFHKEASPLFDMEKLRPGLAIKENAALVPPREHPSHAEHAVPLSDISNYSHDPMNSESFPQTKWKRLMWASVGSAPCTEEHIGAKHFINMIDDLRALPCKKLLVSHEDKENSQILAEAVSQPRQEQ